MQGASIQMELISATNGLDEIEEYATEELFRGGAHTDGDVKYYKLK